MLVSALQVVGTSLTMASLGANVAVTFNSALPFYLNRNVKKKKELRKCEEEGNMMPWVHLVLRIR